MTQSLREHSLVAFPGLTRRVEFSGGHVNVEAWQKHLNFDGDQTREIARGKKTVCTYSTSLFGKDLRRAFKTPPRSD